MYIWIYHFPQVPVLGSPTLIIRELCVLCGPSESERCGESVALKYEVGRKMENGVVEFCSL